MTRSQYSSFQISIIMCLTAAAVCHAQPQPLEAAMHHVRNADPREWSEFPLHAARRGLEISFPGTANDTEQTLILRQHDVKLSWRIIINGHDAGSLLADEKDMITCFTVWPGMLKTGQNTISIQSDETEPDDIRVGEILLDPRPLYAVLSEASIDLEIIGEDGEHIPGHITLANHRGILQTVSAPDNRHLAIRPGHVYTATGKASIMLPAGSYTIYAGRGFEYGIDSARLVLESAQRRQVKLRLKKEVNTEGWVSSDTHIHTLTHSGHGDATDRERVITIAGEGIELPVITDHNVHVDLTAQAVASGVNGYFTLVTGNEVTTNVGHFNVFPLSADEPVAGHQAGSWAVLRESIRQTGAKAVILNHGRDVHRGFRPFDKKLFLQPSGTRTDGQPLFANAMEVLNSGSQQTDILQLTRDWFALLNHGHFVTPVGSSDSHDVSRFIVGQGRTYIRCDDGDAGNISVTQAVKSFLEGKVTVSAGLLAKIVVNDRYGPGELAPKSRKLRVRVQVIGPGWVNADRVSLYANGKKIREAMIPDGRKAGIKWEGNWALDLPGHDQFLVAVAEGPGGNMPYWPLAKPFQPVSEKWTPKVIGITGAVWFDADGNGDRTSALDYADELLIRSNADVRAVIRALDRYDEAVASQIAARLWEKGIDPGGEVVSAALQSASATTRAGFEAVVEALAAARE